MTAALRRGDEITIVDRTIAGGGPVAHGFAALTDAIADAGGETDVVDHWTETDADAVLVVGPTSATLVRRLLESAGDAVPTAAEGVVFSWLDAGDVSALVAAGTDERGLMYALLELAGRVETAGLGALPAVEDRIETPDNAVRGVNRHTSVRGLDEWFFEDAFWRYYLDRLARNRFNRFVLVTGYQTVHTKLFAPPYPFVVDVPGYPGVEPIVPVDRDRETYRSQLRRIGNLCHERGLDFVFGSWSQQSGEEPHVDGLPDDDSFADYCLEGMYELLTAIPEIDGLQLRVNYESGVGDHGDTAEDFYVDMFSAIDRAAADREHDLFLDLRAKGITDEMIDRALETSLDVSIGTKYTWEATGMPYHPSQMRRGELNNIDNLDRRRRYGYSDLLEKPRPYDVYYRVWTIGTNRVLLWGDPDHARRFAESTGFADGTGFEVTAPLTLFRGTEPTDPAADDVLPLFDDPDLRDYEWEDERYWAWYLLFGRLGYSTDTDSDVWEREFERRFGDAADAVLDAYRAASRVAPMLTSVHLTKHPAFIHWAEMDTGAALFADHNHNSRFSDTTYASAEPGDPGLFYRVDEYVADALEDAVGGKYTPIQVSRWLLALADDAREAIGRAESIAPEGAEFTRTAHDCRLLASLAEFHASKMCAAVELTCYQETDDPSYLPAARERAADALAAWESVVEHGDHYADDLVFKRWEFARGHWRDRLDEIEADVAELEGMVAAAEVDPVAGRSHVASVTSGASDRPSIEASVPAQIASNEPVDVSVSVGSAADVEDVTLHYRHTNLAEGEAEVAKMERDDDQYRGTIPAEYVTPEWNLIAYVTAVAGGEPLVHPGVYHVDSHAPYYVIEVRDPTA